MEQRRRTEEEGLQKNRRGGGGEEWEMRGWRGIGEKMEKNKKGKDEEGERKGW